MLAWGNSIGDFSTNMAMARKVRGEEPREEGGGGGLGVPADGLFFLGEGGLGGIGVKGNAPCLAPAKRRALSF